MDVSIALCPDLAELSGAARRPAETTGTGTPRAGRLHPRRPDDQHKHFLPIVHMCLIPPCSGPQGYGGWSELFSYFMQLLQSLRFPAASITRSSLESDSKFSIRGVFLFDVLDDVSAHSDQFEQSFRARGKPAAATFVKLAGPSFKLVVAYASSNVKPVVELTWSRCARLLSTSRALGKLKR